MDVGTVTTPRRCEHCAHFHEEELNTGLCRLHDMYVLGDFDCEKFEQPRTRDGGGDRSAASREKDRERV